MKIALTGGSGFIGKRLVQILADAGHDIKVLQHNRASFEHPNVTAIHGSLTNTQSLNILVEDADVVIHCAALVAAKSSAEFFAVNEAGTRSIAQAAKNAGVKRFLLLSSMAAREPQLSPYAASKRAAEDALKSTQGLKWDALRPPVVYGPGDLHMLDVFKMVKAGVALMPAGADARVSTIYVDDLARGIKAWVDADIASSSLYEIAGSEQNSNSWKELLSGVASTLDARPRYIKPSRFLLTLLTLIAQLAGVVKRSPPFLSRGKVAEMCHPDWACHDRSFEKTTGWSPETSFKDGIVQTALWYKEQSLL